LDPKSSASANSATSPGKFLSHASIRGPTAGTPALLLCLANDLNTRASNGSAAYLHGGATVYHEHFAGDEIIGHEGANCFGHLFWRSLAMEWYSRCKIVRLGFRRHRLMKSRSNDARCHTVDANIVVRFISRETACELQNGSFYR